jgi:hypothetical protein
MDMATQSSPVAAFAGQGKSADVQEFFGMGKRVNPSL